MSESSRSLDRFATTVDHEGLVANAGLILAGTLMARLGVSALIERWVRTGSANPGPKILTVVAAMLAGGTHISIMSGCCAPGAPVGCWDSSRRRPRRSGRCGGRSRSVMSASSKRCCRALWRAPGDWARAPARRRWWSIWTPRSARSTANKNKEPRTACTKVLGYHPLLAARADTGEVLGARMRKGSAGSSRGVVRFVDELVANLRRAGADRADHGARRLRILVPQADRPSRRPRRQVVDHRRPRIRCSRSDPSNRRHRMDRHRLHQQRPRPSRRNRPMPPAAAKQKRTVRLVVRRTRLTEGAQQRLWPDWRHHAFNANTEHDTAAAADEFHRAHAVVELAIRDLKEGTGLEHVPSGHYGANCAPLACAVLAHNIGHPTTALTGAPPATNRSRRTRLVALAAVAVNRSGTPTLRYPARWPWAPQFTSHTQRPQGSARTLRLTRTARNRRPHTNPASTTPNHTPTPSRTRPNTPNHTPNNPTRPQPATDPANPALTKSQSVDSG